MLPVGAFGQHGPCLPVVTDTLIATAFTDAISHHCKEFRLPLITFGCSVRALNFPRNAEPRPSRTCRRCNPAAAPVTMAPSRYRGDHPRIRGRRKVAAVEWLAAAPTDEGLVLRDVWLLRLHALLARDRIDDIAATKSFMWHSPPYVGGHPAGAGTDLHQLPAGCGELALRSPVRPSTDSRAP